MKSEISRIHAQADAIRQHTAELVAELAALPPLNLNGILEQAINQVSQSLLELTGDSVCIELESWRHDTSPDKVNLKYRVWLCDVGLGAYADTLEAARANAEQLWREHQAQTVETITTP
jgi:hypothetical protein